jgi:hypothetical protein
MRLAKLFIILLVLCSTCTVEASEKYITTYIGRYSDDRLGDVLTNKPVNFEDAYIAVLAVSKIFHNPQPSYQWEVEGQIGKYFREQDHWEFNIAAIIRWNRFPWNHYLRTSLAIGEGLSFATEVPPLEEQSKTNSDATRLLNYVLIEMTVSPPQQNRWSIVGRIHHRSGVFGLFDDVTGGSNVLGMGIRYAY